MLAMIPVLAPETLHMTLLPGRAAAEIQSADELVVTELMFTGVFSALNPEQIVALTSCFVWTEKAQVGVKVRYLCPPLPLPRTWGLRMGAANPISQRALGTP